MTGRTVSKFARVYVDGRDLSGFMVSPGPLSSVYSQVGGAHLSDPIKGFLPGRVTNQVGSITGMFDSSSGGVHELSATLNPEVVRTVMVALGIQAIPAVGDPVFAGDFNHIDYITAPGDEEIAFTAMVGPSIPATTMLYPNPWGLLALEKSTKTGVNSAVATIDFEAQTAFGGYACFHLISSDGTVTLKIQDSASNIDGNFADLLSSGVIDASVTPVGKIVQLALASTVERYIRWQLTLGDATTLVAAMSFHRATRAIR